MSLISDAGTPLLSDPGRILLNSCINQKINVIPIPGVSSITTAMSISGFDDKFLFYGFLPKTDNEVEKLFKLLTNFEFSIIFFAPAVKLNFYLKKIKKYFYQRKLIIAKEMTKIHENYFRDEVKKLSLNKIQAKGEITLILSEENLRNRKIDKTKIVNKAKKYLKKYSLKDTVELIMETENINKNEIYKLCLKIKNEKNI